MATLKDCHTALPLRLALNHHTAKLRGVILRRTRKLRFLIDDVYQTGDLVLASRLRALADAGRIEAKGDLTQPMYSEARLPQRANSA